MTTVVNRRDFVKGTMAAVAATTFTAQSYGRIIGANDRIQIGILGCGSRGTRAHMPGIAKHAKAENIHVTAVCDPWRVARETANELVKETYGHEAKQFISYRDLLQYKDLDAVMIASCDHHHAVHLEAVARAKKHVYIEKPMARNMKELLKCYDATKASGVVVQVGTQIRSLPTSTGCRELYASGILGKVSRIEQHRNSEKPYWYGYLKDVKKEDVVWEEFLMNAPKRPFRSDLYSGWYGYMDYTDGPVYNLGVHFVDLMLYITGAKFPSSCVCLGGVFTWKDEHNFTCPDHVEALWVFPEGFMVAYTTNFGNGSGNRLRFCGEKGVLNLDNWSAPTYSALGGPKRDGGIRGDNEVKAIDGPDHFQDWLQCMRSGKPTRAPLEAGYLNSIAGIMAVESYNKGYRTVYDHKTRTIKAG